MRLGAFSLHNLFTAASKPHPAPHVRSAPHTARIRACRAVMKLRPCGEDHEEKGDDDGDDDYV